MEKQQFKALLDKYTAGEATPREEELIQKLLQSHRDHADVPHFTEDEKQETGARMLANIMSHTNPAPRRSIYAQIYKWATAAAVLLAIGAAWVFYKPAVKTQPTLVVKKAAPSTLQAGGNKAYLKLADGSVVALNDRDNGLIAQQGGTNITKTADGKLQYTAGNKTATSALNTITTPNGGTYQLTLPDGTKVWLNAASSLTFPTRFDGRRRYVKLVGEAYFEVAKKYMGIGKSRLPFIVDAGQSQVEVLGTHFNVSTYADRDEQQTTLLEGAVAVKHGNKQVRIVPGQQAVLDKDGKMAVQQANIESVMAWKEGLFLFDNTDIAVAMKDIARWYNAKVVYKGEMPVTAFTGVLPRNSDIASVLELLESTHAVKCGLSGGTITIEKTN